MLIVSNPDISSRIPKLILGAPGTSPAILLKPDFACVVALGYGIKHMVVLGKALWHNGLWSFTAM